VDKTILVADDEAHIRHIVSMKLRNAGYKIITAMDGEEALELCLAAQPDLVITDFQMPLMTGLELCREFHSCREMQHVPAVMLTARGFDIAPGEMIDAGIAIVLAKPFSPRELLDKVNELLACEPAGESS
jgi:DNA-binding response OmpR family regulator